MIAAVVAAIVVFLLKGHSRILLQRKSEESMKIGLPKKVQRTYKYATFFLAYGNHESSVINHLTSELDDLSANQKELERARGSPAPLRGYLNFTLTNKGPSIVRNQSM